MIDRSAAHWFTSSHSGPSQDCVEIAHFDGGQVGVRDSKNPTGPALTFAPPRGTHSWPTRAEASSSGHEFGTTRRLDLRPGSALRRRGRRSAASRTA
ncbi:DUF397 domain-containing protein [Nocardia cyriacigeorgica]|uniref:DUF397 domain-containing protein n=1 Tax=Nocardia cyriacigeorgica TaxID=135487 RepID=UPI003980BD33